MSIDGFSELNNRPIRLINEDAPIIREAIVDWGVLGRGTKGPIHSHEWIGFFGYGSRSTAVPLQGIKPFLPEELMETAAPVAGLYASVLGAAWNDLDEAVRRLHSGDIRATGAFRVVHGSNVFSRLLAWAGRLPAAGENIDLQLVVVANEHSEVWRRSFAGKLLVSTQWKRSDGMLAEAMEPSETGFQLAVVSGALHYQSQSAALRLGPLRIPLPNWLAPRMTAREEPAGSSGQVFVWVEVTLPLLGRLIHYEGTVVLMSTGAPP